MEKDNENQEEALRSDQERVIGDERAPGVQLVPSDTEPPGEGLLEMDRHLPGAVVVDEPGGAGPLTAKDYRDAGYGVDDKLGDSEIPALVQADRPAELRTVVLADGEQVAGDDIPTAVALESRLEAKTPDEVTAEAIERSDGEEDHVVVDTHPTPVEAIEGAADKQSKPSKRGRPKGAATAEK